MNHITMGNRVTISTHFASVYNSWQTQVVKYLCTVSPYIYRPIFPLAFIIKPIYLHGNRSIFTPFHTSIVFYIGLWLVTIWCAKTVHSQTWVICLLSWLPLISAILSGYRTYRSWCITQLLGTHSICYELPWVPARGETFPHCKTLCPQSLPRTSSLFLGHLPQPWRVLWGHSTVRECLRISRGGGGGENIDSMGNGGKYIFYRNRGIYSLDVALFYENFPVFKMQWGDNSI